MAINPFSRNITAKKSAAAEPATPVASAGAAAAATVVLERESELQQPATESDGGHAEDTPDVVNNNEGASTQSFGLTEFQSPEKVVDGPDDGADAGVATLPASRRDELGLGDASFGGGGSGGGIAVGAGGGGGGGGIGAIAGAVSGIGVINGGSVQDALTAAGGDLTAPGNLTGSALDALHAVTGGNPLNAQALGAIALVDEAANSVAAGPSVAADGDAADVAEAVAESIGAFGALVLAAAAVPAAAVATLGVLEVAAVVVAGGTAYMGAAKADEATDGWASIITVAGGGVANLPIGIIAGGFAAAGELVHQAEEDDVFQASVGGMGVRKLEARDAGNTPKTAGGGVRDPGSNEDQPLTAAERAFAEAAKAELGIRHIPGDIDPLDGDGTSGGTASEGNVGPAEVILRSGAIGLVGQPREDAPAPRPAGGGSSPTRPDGTEILVEDGNPFTGGQRNEDDPNFDVGGRPLIGFSNDDDDGDADDDTSTAFSRLTRRLAKDTDDD